MEQEVRRAVAFIAVKATEQSRLSNVYDYSAGKHAIFSGSVADNRVSLYDHDVGAHVQGHLTQFYHYGTGGHVQLSIRGNSFTGYDYSSGSSFSGTIRRRNVQIYDYGTGSYHQFLVS